MKNILKNILADIAIEQITGSDSIIITSIQSDSRLVQSDCLFVAVKGTVTDGHQYINKAIEQGASAIICEILPPETNNRVTYILVKNSAQALGIAAHNFYDKPSHKLKLVGVTGTNGKTTTATLLYRMMQQFGYKTGLLSTVRNYISEKAVEATHTTPDPVQLNSLLAQMVNAGCDYCFMEVSSHAIVQQRIAGLQFVGGIFSNITHDHLDYHKTFAEYIKAKKLFFDELPKNAFALINTDDKNGKIMVQNTKAKVAGFALESLSDYKCKIIESGFEGMLLNVDGIEVWTHFIGRFNAYNLLSVYATACLLGFEKNEVLTVLSNLYPVEGRFDTIRLNGITAIVDYAHTPDALENVLNTINEIRIPGQTLTTVVGAGGNRDKTKRPLMAKISVKLSDRLILTSDNPRNEEPEAILNDMYEGIGFENARKVLKILDRKEAIKTACMMAQKGDIILIAGKGHENYQEIKGVKHHFDDKEVVMAQLSQMN